MMRGWSYSSSGSTRPPPHLPMPRHGSPLLLPGAGEDCCFPAQLPASKGLVLPAASPLLLPAASPLLLLAACYCQLNRPCYCWGVHQMLSHSLGLGGQPRLPQEGRVPLLLPTVPHLHLPAVPHLLLSAVPNLLLPPLGLRKGALGPVRGQRGAPSPARGTGPAALVLARVQAAPGLR